MFQRWLCSLHILCAFLQQQLETFAKFFITNKKKRRILVKSIQQQQQQQYTITFHGLLLSAANACHFNSRPQTSNAHLYGDI